VTDQPLDPSPSDADGPSSDVPVRAGRLTKAAVATPPARSGLPDVPLYEDISPHLLSSLRSLIDRFELQSGELPSPLAVTSPGPDTDTTIVSQALARILAHEHGNYVLWMGSDWLGEADDQDEARMDGRSLLDVLANKASVRSVLIADPEHPQLAQLATGPIPVGHGHIIARSPAFEQLLSLLEQEFDHVIIDCPPLLGAGDGLALLPRTNGYVLVVRHRSVSTGHVRQANELAAPIPNVGVVVTNYVTRVPKIVRRLFGD
jgi:Mrp family chromosome partitioning ATPase